MELVRNAGTHVGLDGTRRLELSSGVRVSQEQASERETADKTY